MKLLLFLFLLFPIILLGQNTEPSKYAADLLSNDSSIGVAGFKLGENYNQVLKKSIQKFAKKPYINRKDTFLVFEKVKFAENNAGMFMMEFYKGQLYTITALIHPEYETPEELYTRIKTDISSKYFIPQIKKENFNNPVYEGENKINSILSAKQGVVSMWYFPERSFERDIIRTIVLKIEEHWVSLTYADELTQAKRQNHDSQKRQRDL